MGQLASVRRLPIGGSGPTSASHPTGLPAAKLALIFLSNYWYPNRASNSSNHKRGRTRASPKVWSSAPYLIVYGDMPCHRKTLCDTTRLPGG